MKLIIDNNILFSLMKPDSTASKIFSILSCEFIAPLFVIKEFEKYEDECLKKSRLSNKKFHERKKQIFSKINFIKYEFYKEFINEAINSISDFDDAPYFALALKLNIPIWSNDSILKKQNKIKVLSTKEIIDVLFG